MPRWRGVAKFSAVVLIACVGAVVGGWLLASRLAPTSATQTDVAALERLVPILGRIERCWWQTGVATDRSGGRVPAPSASYLRAYVILDAWALKQLIEDDSWTEATGPGIPTLPQPPGPGFPLIRGPFRQSSELVRSLSTTSTYHAGTILVQPSDRLVYLDLLTD